MATSAGILVPRPMHMKGDLANNREFVKGSWTNYNMKIEKIIAATLMSNNWKRTLQIYCHLPMTKEEHKKS